MTSRLTARLAAASLLGAGGAAAGLGLAATAGWLIARASEHPNMAALGLAVVGVRFFGISRGLLRYAERLVGHDAAFRVLAEVRMKVYARLERLAPAGLPAFRSGDLLARFVDDVDSLQDLLLRVVSPYVVFVASAGLTIGLVGTLVPTAGVVVLVAALLCATAVPVLARQLVRRSEARQAETRGELSTAVVDLVQGAPDLIAFGAAKAQLLRAGRADAELARVARAAARTAGTGSGLTTLLAGLCVWGVLAAGIVAVDNGQLPGVLLTVVVLVSLASFELVTGLPQAFATLERVRRCRERVDALLAVDDPVREPTDPVPLPAAPYSIRLRGVRARYPSGRLALDGIDLDLAPGDSVAVVGPSGAGKSTLAAILMRFLELESGMASLNGVCLGDLESDALRRVVGLAGQDAHVFDRTIGDNLRLGRPDATEAETRAALAEVGLLAWVDGLPNGLATEVGEHGARLSGGQRQRLVVARALLGDFPVLILDEPTEHLDPGAAGALTANLLAAASGRTTLLITHRLSGLQTVDRILLLEAGRVVESGTHADLIAAGGAYSRIWNREQGHLIRSE
ncbi:ATP-binding cassette subfamily C protein CydC [Kribbella orskensis]|uniref:ATP-binding cassette subfamily C protein CydC n=1 Tax=Kribbella orskensis TaxID=2512216 RepID=A0ABY2BRR4_9ACTN|nr:MULTISPECIES: thiol reductant ABC exporter subunit CydC [Kribbella]TCN43049.1 ATP-binding cassette subfamily C protein CydC [Kribbella sp. VKM Ac-2500]TCO29595.1 ATP-binding cassette subfamily C protein CydC [Kribbella orskensis]